MTCKDCLCCDVCEYNEGLHRWCSPSIDCPHFKPKSRFVELPCEVGSTVWFISNGKERKGTVISITMLLAQSAKALSIHIQNVRGATITFGLHDFGKTVFLSREEAEKALLRKEDEGK